MKKCLIIFPIFLLVSATSVIFSQESIRNFTYKSTSLNLYSAQSLKEGNTLFSVLNLFDNNPSTCWATPFDEYSDHQNTSFDENKVPIRIVFNDSIYLKDIIFKNGFQLSKKLYYNNHRAQSIIIDAFLIGGYGYPKPINYDLKDNFEPQSINIDKKIIFSDLFPTHELYISFESVFSSNKYQDLCISDIELNFTNTIPYKPTLSWNSLKVIIDKNKTLKKVNFWDWNGLFEDRVSLLKDLIYYSLSRNKEALKYIKSLSPNSVMNSELIELEVLPRIKAVLNNDY